MTIHSMPVALRFALPILAGATLAGCGGSSSKSMTPPPTYTIGGRVIGLASGATVHVLNGNDNQPVTANGAFTLPTAIVGGTPFSVSVGTPAPTGQTCAVQNATGTVGTANVTNVVVYCAYAESLASLTGSGYAAAGFNINTNTAGLLTGLGFDGMGTISNSTGMSNVAGTTFATAPYNSAGAYTVVTTSAIPVLTAGGNNLGAIAGADTDAFFWLANTSVVGGAPPALLIGVQPLQNGTLAALAGTWVSAGVTAGATNPHDEEGPTTINADGSGSSSSSRLSLDGTTGTVMHTLPAGTLAVTTSGELVPSGGTSLGYFAANGEVLIESPVVQVAGGASANEPGLDVAIKLGTGVTAATLNGVYTIGSLGFDTSTTGSGAVFTIFFDGAGNYSGTYTQNNNGTVTTAGNTAAGTYAVTSTGLLTLTATDGTVQTGAVTADGNYLVAASLTAGGAESPRMFFGVRQ